MTELKSLESTRMIAVPRVSPLDYLGRTAAIRTADLQQCPVQIHAQFRLKCTLTLENLLRLTPHENFLIVGTTSISASDALTAPGFPLLAE